MLSHLSFLLFGALAVSLLPDLAVAAEKCWGITAEKKPAILGHPFC